MHKDDSLRNKPLVVLIMVVSVFFLMGCTLFGDPQHEAERESAERFQQQMEVDTANQEDHKALADQKLAAGDVLSVRVEYGDSGVTACKVRIDNKRNDWYDYIEWTGVHGLANDVKTYEDFNFGSTNFNTQMTNEIKNPKFDNKEDIKGDYEVVVTASNGFVETTKVIWNGEQFTPSMLHYSVK